jgi:hypothetical protein
LPLSTKCTSDLHGRVVHARHAEAVEVLLIDAAVGRGDLAEHRQPDAHHRRAFELRAHAIGIDDDARVGHLMTRGIFTRP